MKKLIAALALLGLMVLGLSPAHSDIKYTPTHKTLTDAVGRAILLNDIQNAVIEAVVKENPYAER
jgi:glycine/serine hydroxymethyltransferase